MTGYGEWVERSTPVTDAMVDRAVRALLDGPFRAVQRVSDDTMRLWVRTALTAALEGDRSSLDDAAASHGKEPR